MADFRRWIYALALVALLAGFTVPVSATGTGLRALSPPGNAAQQVEQALTGTATLNSTVVRAQSLAETVGDVTLSRTGALFAKSSDYILDDGIVIDGAGSMPMPLLVIETHLGVPVDPPGTVVSRPIHVIQILLVSNTSLWTNNLNTNLPATLTLNMTTGTDIFVAPTVISDTTEGYLGQYTITRNTVSAVANLNLNAYISGTKRKTDNNATAVAERSPTLPLRLSPHLTAVNRV